MTRKLLARERTVTTSRKTKSSCIARLKHTERRQGVICLRLMFLGRLELSVSLRRKVFSRGCIPSSQRNLVSQVRREKAQQGASNGLLDHVSCYRTYDQTEAAESKSSASTSRARTGRGSSLTLGRQPSYPHQ